MQRHNYEGIPSGVPAGENEIRIFQGKEVEGLHHIKALPPKERSGPDWIQEIQKGVWRFSSRDDEGKFTGWHASDEEWEALPFVRYAR